MNELEIYCPNREKGCNKVLRYGVIPAHKNQDCLYETVSCPNVEGGCRHTMLRRDVTQHLAESCSFSVDCPCCHTKVASNTEEHCKCILNMTKELQRVRHELEACEKKMKSMEEKKSLVDECRKKFMEKRVPAADIEIYTSASAEPIVAQLAAQPRPQEEEDKVAIARQREREAEERKARMLPDGRVTCKHCGRAFNGRRIDKHEAVCVAGKAVRKVFDSSAVRAIESESHL